MFKKKCFICKQKDEKKNLNRYTIGNFEYYKDYYYHLNCLKVASCNAKEYNNFVLELIIDIVDYIKFQKANRAKILLNCNKICKELQGNDKAPTGNPHQTT